MKVILVCDVPGQGKKSETINVSEGFARNYLLKQGKAVLATAQMLKKIESRKAKENEELQKFIAGNREKVAQLKELKLEITAESKDGKLFGAIGSREIEEALSKKGIEVERKSIELKKSIKVTGDYRIKIKLDKENQVEVDLKIA